MPSSVPSLVIIVTSLEDEDMGGHLAYENMGIAARQQLYDGGSQVSHKIFLQLIIQPIKTNGVLNNHKIRWSIQSVRIACQLCFEWARKQSKIEPIYPIPLSNLEAIAFPEKNSLILWNFDGYDGDKTSSALIIGMFTCVGMFGVFYCYVDQA